MAYGRGNLGGVFIKSVQRGVSTVTTPVTVSIDEVDLDKSVILIQGLFDDGDGQAGAAVVSFDSSTELYIGGQNYNTTTVIWQVIEFYNVKSLQSGYTTSETTTITQVNLNKSILFYNGGTTSTGTLFDCEAYLSDSTTITNTGIYGFHYYVVEFF